MLDFDDESDLPVLELQILLVVAVGEDGQFLNTENEDDLVRAERNDPRLSQEHVEVEVDAAVHQPRALDLRQAPAKFRGLVCHGGLAPLLVQVLVDVTDRIAADGEVGEHLLESQSVAGQGVVNLDGRLLVIKVGKVIEDVVAGLLEESEVFLHVNFNGCSIGRVLWFKPRKAGILNKLLLEPSGPVNPGLLTNEIKNEHLNFVMSSVADFAFSAAYGLPLERHAVRQLETREERGVLAANGRVRKMHVLGPIVNQTPTRNYSEKHHP